jgi:class 3 adenylate cyclase
MAEDGAGGGNLRRARLAAGRSYGAPLDDPEHRWHAAHAAVAMHAALEGLSRRREAQGRGPLAMGIAAHTGATFTGTRRGPRKKKYAVLAVLKDPVVVRDRGRVTVKGRGQPVEIYELMSLMAA